MYERHLDSTRDNFTPSRLDSSCSSFTYSALDNSVDSVRLVILEPSITPGSILHCRLVHVTFGQMPKYEALSYTWGSDDPQIGILLDRKAFPVRANLREALLHLRKLNEERVLWIDAICINQDDIPERNQQVRIMPHIYSRAQMVLVWLGDDPESRLGIKVSDNSMTHSRSTWKGEGLTRMSAVDYWNRVWIVQEIGKARRIMIHYGSRVVDWETFIVRMRYTTWLRGCIPLKLANQMLDKYGDGYKLENLLKTHRKALCKDVRDKIYGFTGLANDVHGRLAVDYGKTPYEVWEDVVRFRSADSTVPQYDILHFATLARDLLGGHLKTIDEHVPLENHTLGSIYESLDSLILCPARLWGRIAWVGPTYDQIRSNLCKVDEWTASVKDHVFDPYLRSAVEESDLFLQLLEDIDPSDLKVVFPITHSREYSLDACQGEGLEVMNRIEPKSSHLVADMVATADTDELFEDKHLILLDLCLPIGLDNSEASKQFGGIGIAPCTARVGDFICYFYQKERAVVVRRVTVQRHKNYFVIIGSAAIPDVRAMAAEKVKDEGKLEARFAVLNNSPLKESETINLYMNIGSLYEWSF